MSISIPKAVIFDMDGLLFDTERLGYDVWSRVGHEMGFSFDETLLLAGIGIPLETHADMIATVFGPSFDRNHALARYNTLFDELIEHDGVPVKKGVYQFIDFLSRNDIVRALATSSDAYRTDYLLTRAGLEDAFDEIVTVSMVSSGKPEPDLFLKACEMLAVMPSHAVVLEDSAPGLVAAHRGGIPAIWIPDMKPVPDPIEHLAEATFSSLDDLRRSWSRTLVNTR